jgi:hypothetical protein
MRLGLMLLCTGAALALTASAANANDGAGDNPAADLVAGTVKVPLATPVGTFPAQMHVNAIGTATEASGDLWVTLDASDSFLGEIHFSGEVTCVNAIGNVATFRGVVTASDSPFVPVGSGTLGQRVDNGQGEGARPDESAGILTSPVPGPCPPPSLTTLPVEQGNVLVHDGS